MSQPRARGVAQGDPEALRDTKLDEACLGADPVMVK